MPSVTDLGPTPERLHALDAVRGFALLLGIILHATGSFISTPTRFWIIQDTHPSMTLAVLFFAIHVCQRRNKNASACRSKNASRA